MKASLLLLTAALAAAVCLPAAAEPPLPEATMDIRPGQRQLSPIEAFKYLDSLQVFNQKEHTLLDEIVYREATARFRQNIQLWKENPETVRDYPWAAELLGIAYRSRTAFLIRPDILQSFISITSDINAEDAYGYTVMDYAVRESVSQFFQPLLAAGAKADVTRCDEDGRTALYFAVFEGNRSVAEYLLQQGSYVNDFSHDGTSILSLALEQGHQEIVDMLLATGAKMEPDWEDDAGYTLLHHAAAGGCTEQVRRLIQKGADISAATTEGKWTPLMLAAIHGHTDTVDELLKHGANLRQKNDFGSTALEEAVGEDSPCFPVLFREARKQHLLTEQQLSELLEEAIIGDKGETACFLLQNGARFNADDMGWQYLGFALRRGDTKLLRLLEKAGAQYDACTPDDEGVTQLMLAAQQGYRELTEQFLEDGADVHAEDNEGTNVMTYALIGGNEQIIELLREAGAILSPHAATPEAETHLLLAARHGLIPQIKELMKQRAAVNARSKTGKTALMEALSHGQEDAVKLLLQFGAKWKDNPTPGSPTLLMCAAQGGSESYVSKLLGTGSDPNRVIFPASDADTPAGTTALMIAAQHGHEKIVRLLINAGAFPHLCNEDGQTAADLARENGHTTLADYLQSLP